MKTTIILNETVFDTLKREAVRRGRTMSELIETALRIYFQSPKMRSSLTALPTFKSGGTFVEVADRDALYQAMEGR